MRKDMIKGLLGSIAFAVGGILTLTVGNPSLPGQIISWVVIAFFGPGAVVIAIRIARHHKPQFHSTIPSDTEIRKLVPADPEIEEEWSYSSPTQPLLSAYATKWKEESEYRWKVCVYLASLAPDPESAEVLDLPMYEAMKNTKNVVDVGREDTEVWVISGEPSGSDLVANAGAALAKCIPSIVPHLQRAQKGT